jgi:hypothetical protein
MMDWGAWPSWTFVDLGGEVVAKVQDTAVATTVHRAVRDANVELSVYGTARNKIVGYRLRIQGTPRILPLPQTMGIFYSTAADTSPRRIETVLHHDPNVRLICFRRKNERDYLWVLRKR